MNNEQTIIIGIPGRWKDRNEITESILNKSDGYSYAGIMLVNSSTQDSFGLEIYEHDPQLKPAFEFASMGKMSEEELQAIGEHTFTVYVIGTGGNLEAAKKMLLVGQALLKTGGLGVKVETAGNAFSPQQWNALCNLEDDARCYDAFVTKLQAQDDVYFTCGMQNLGFKDTIIGGVDGKIASFVMDMFSVYQIMENPMIIPGEKFAPDETITAFQIFEEKDNRYPEEDGFHNPKGLWVLRPIG